jgi:putative spermidine/putrescine transport system ATP-binding protein
MKSETMGRNRMTDRPSTAAIREDPPGPAVDRVPALDMRGLVKLFGEVRAVAGVDLAVRSGEFLTLLGPSGSGKTTILKLIAGFERPTSGRILLDGEDIARLSPAERQIGVVFQHYALFPHMTVRDNVAYPLKLRHWSRGRRGERVREALALVRLEGYEERYPRELSGGQQQRVAVARALAFHPRLLLMDEPLGALDRALRVEMQEELRRIHRESNATVIYVTHDQEEALTLSDRVAILREGRLQQIGAPRDLYRVPTNRFVATFFGECTLVPARVLRGESEHAAVVAALGREFTAKVGGNVDGPDALLVVRPGKIRLRPAPGDLLLPVTVQDVLYLGDAARVVCASDGAGQVLVSADPEDALGLAIQEPLTVGFAPADTVVVSVRE